MARIIDLIADSSGTKHLEFGFNANELATFSIRLWITHYGKRAVDWVQSLSLGFVSFQGGDIWVSNDTTVPRCNLFGEQKTSKVAVVANENSNVIKLLDSIGIHSDSPWEVESVTIQKSLNHPNGMVSKIPKERFKKREGVWRAEFLRNMLTTSGTVSTIEAIRGESLRGYSAVIVLKNSDTTETKLFKVDIAQTSSR
jgi:hypothetical protein